MRVGRVRRFSDGHGRCRGLRSWRKERDTASRYEEARCVTVPRPCKIYRQGCYGIELDLKLSSLRLSDLARDRRAFKLCFDVCNCVLRKERPQLNLPIMIMAQGQASNLDLVAFCDKYISGPTLPQARTALMRLSYPYEESVLPEVIREPLYTLYLPYDDRPHGELFASNVQLMPW